MVGGRSGMQAASFPLSTALPVTTFLSRPICAAAWRAPPGAIVRNSEQRGALESGAGHEDLHRAGT